MEQYGFKEAPFNDQDYSKKRGPHCHTSRSSSCSARSTEICGSHQEQPDNDDLDEKTNAYFKFKVVDKTAQKQYQVVGSNRLFSIIKLLTIGLMILCLANIFLPENCDEEYLVSRCNQKRTLKCIRIEQCLANDQMFFSWHENVILYMAWTLIVLFLNNIQKPLNLKFSSSKNK